MPEQCPETAKQILQTLEEAFREEPLMMGEVRKVENTDIKEHLESKEYYVCWVVLEGEPVPLAFTSKELSRPMTRAKKNQEDISALQAKPPSWEDYNCLRKKSEQLEKENEALVKRGLLARIFNVMPDTD